METRILAKREETLSKEKVDMNLRMAVFMKANGQIIRLMALETSIFPMENCNTTVNGETMSTMVGELSMRTKASHGSNMRDNSRMGLEKEEEKCISKTM